MAGDNTLTKEFVKVNGAAISAGIQWLAAATNWKASSTALIPAFEPNEFVSIFEY